MLEPYGIREMVQSGMVALGRGPRSMTQAALRAVRALRGIARLTERGSSRPAAIAGRHRDGPTEERERQQMAVEMYYDDDADLSIVQGRKVAVLGFGSQGHAHALSLRDSGVDVRVGLPEGSRAGPRPRTQGLRVLTPGRGLRPRPT